jgi:hypothetical protein
MAAPEKFDGDRAKFKTFILQLRLIFMVNPDSFKTEPMKIAALGNLLIGVAATWFNPFIESPEKHPGALNSFDDFVDRMTKFFGPIDRTFEATLEINNLTQGNKSVTEYAALFLQCSEDLQWNDAALINHFQRGLSSHVKDMLVMVPEVDNNLTSLINHAIQFDNRYRENATNKNVRSFERPRRGYQDQRHSGTRWPQNVRGNNFNPYPPRPPPNFKNNYNPTHRHPFTPPTTNRMPDHNAGTPMEIDAMESKIPTRNTEREHRYSKGLCLTCGQAGHLRATCPQRRHNAGLEIFHQPHFNQSQSSPELNMNRLN